MSLNFKQWKKIICEVVFLATLKEKVKGKKPWNTIKQLVLMGLNYIPLKKKKKIIGAGFSYQD